MFLGGALDKVEPEEVPEVVHTVTAYWMLLPVMTVPSMILGALGMRKKGLGAIILGTLLLLIPAGILIYTLVALLAPMYEYQPI